MEENSFNFFLKSLKDRMIYENLPVDKLSYNKMSDGVINFTYDDYQIGRVYFGKRTSKMQLIDGKKVIWLVDRPFNEYLTDITFWIKYIKLLDKAKKAEDIELKSLKGDSL